MTSSASEPRSYRPLLGVGGFVYLGWWFAVEWLLPGAFNPLASRLVVVAYFLSAYAASFAWPGVRARADTLFYVGALGLVGHYFYLFLHNAADLNWTVGAYIVVFALCVMVQSRGWLLGFAGFSFACGAAVWALSPSLQKTIFLPGLGTILALCLFVLLNRIRLLESLSESTERFEGLFDATFEGIAVIDRGEVIDANASFALLFGHSLEDLLGRSLVELSAPETRMQVAVRVQDKGANRYEAIGMRADGARFAAEIASKPHLYQGRTLQLAAVRDVSDRQRAEQERITRIEEQVARASAQEAIRLRDEFISVASHELRTPITSLVYNLGVFVRRWPKEQKLDELELYATRATRQLDKMRRLVEELLDVSRLGSGRLTLTTEPVELSTIVHDAVDTMSDDVHRAACTVDVRIDANSRGDWDRLRLEQVVENLLRNALTYGAGCPIEIILDRSAEGRARLTVCDHGIGIDSATQERVFLRFERGVSAQHYGGLGLGLYIAKQIVEAHGGTIRVASEPGKGATFVVELPPSALHDSAAASP